MEERAICNAFANDAAYFRALTAGEETEINNAWICLYITHTSYKEKVLSHLGLDPLNDENKQDAEDAYQESIIAVVYGIQNGRIVPGKSKISTYLFSCCKYQVLGMKRKKVRFMNKNYTNEQQKTISDEQFSIIISEAEAEYKEKTAIIKKAVAELRSGCADILYRFLYRKEDPAFIAAEKKIGLRSVRTDISRCKEDLVKHLILKYKFPPDGLWL
jgi:DNA-directed RNA polymerase specialized sigma24 family protein